MKVRMLATAAVLLAVPAGSTVGPASAVARSGGKPRAAHHHVQRGARKSRTVKFYARVVRASSRGLIVRTAQGRVMSFSSRQIRRAAVHKHHARRHRHGRLHGAFDLQLSAGNVVVNILGLQPGTLVQITETTDADGTVTITITLPPAGVQETTSGVVTEVGAEAFRLQAADGSSMRLYMAESALAGLGLQTCSTVDVTYHQDAGLLIADRVNSTGVSTSGDCTPTEDATGTITQVSADALTIRGENGPVTFSVDPASGLTGGYQIGDLVDVTYTQAADGTLTATGLQFVEQDTSGRVTSVMTSTHGGTLTILDDQNGQAETFNADPNNGVQINARAFNGVSVGDQIEVTYHQSAGQLIADTVSEQ